MKRVKVKHIQLLKFNKYLVTPTCNHSFVNDTSVTKVKDLPVYVNCVKCPDKP
jgi:transcription elongation factor Elf1